MSAHEWFRFFQWFDGLPRCQYALKEDLEKIAPSAVPESLVEPLNRACYHRFVERFDWLSTECLELMSDMKNHQASQRQIERNEILQAATAKRQVENQRKGVLFSSRRAKWEKDTEKRC